jgi:hypothetical protein
MARPRCRKTPKDTEVRGRPRSAPFWSGKIIDEGGGCLGSPYQFLRRVEFTRCRLVGPIKTESGRTVDFYTDDSPASVLRDKDLVLLFDQRMELGPWLDMVAERHPHLQVFADEFGRLRAE